MKKTEDKPDSINKNLIKHIEIFTNSKKNTLNLITQREIP